MKHIEIYADSAISRDQGAGFAVILVSLNHRWERSFSIGGCTANQAALQATKFGLLSIAECYKNHPVKLFVKSKYVRDMLAKDSDGYFKMNPSVNKDIIDEIRTLIDDRNVEVSDGKGNKDSDACKKLVGNAVKGIPVDNRK